MNPLLEVINILLCVQMHGTNIQEQWGATWELEMGITSLQLLEEICVWLLSSWEAFVLEIHVNEFTLWWKGQMTKWALETETPLSPHNMAFSTFKASLYR